MALISFREETDNMEENREILLTQEGYDNLEKELEYLKTEKRTERHKTSIKTI